MKSIRFACLALVIVASHGVGAAEPIPDGLVVLTFDDSNKSDITVVAPILERYGFGATFYVTRGLGAETDHTHFLTWDEVVELDRRGFEIGNHTKSHPNVAALEKEQIRAEIDFINEACVERGLEQPTTFCYPGFHHAPHAVEVLQERKFAFARRGVAPEFRDGGRGGRGPAYDPEVDHPLLVPTTGYAGPDWGIHDLVWAVDQARGGKIAVLCFHGVPGPLHPWVHTAPEVFEHYMRYLRDRDCTVIAMRDLAKYVDLDRVPEDPYASLRARIEARAVEVAEPVRPTGDDVVPFTIAVDEGVLDDLERRLGATRFPDQIEGADWDYGVERGYLQSLLEYWRTDYDWRAQERELNRWAHFKTRIEDLEIHFVHERSKHEDAMPLLLLHGWPGSFYEFRKVIGPLTDPEAHGGAVADAFHVVIPSLPGFAFSSAPRQRGWNNARIAEVMAKLMRRLGYDHYGAQGGDWGASVATWLGRNDAARCRGVHINFVYGGPPDGDTGIELTDAERARVRERRDFMRHERAYSEIQATKPQTLGYGLSDSPAGLAAWIIEKFRTWSDCDGHLESRFTKDELLTNVMLYWATGSITSSTRIYYETRHSRGPGVGGRVEVPVGCAIFPHELVYSPRSWAETRLNVTRWTEMPRGGHFAALEEPALLTEDVRAFFRQVREREP